MRNDDKQVLVVEDDDAIRDVLVEILDEIGYRAVPTANGREALAQLRSGSPLPAAILLDLMMPVMSGFELAEVIADDEGLRTIPIVVMTASVGSEAVRDAGNVRGYLRKPLSIAELLAALQRVC